MKHTIQTTKNSFTIGGVPSHLTQEALKVHTGNVYCCHQKPEVLCLTFSMQAGQEGTVADQRSCVGLTWGGPHPGQATDTLKPQMLSEGRL